jgi:hypothetical protein
MATAMGRAKCSKLKLDVGQNNGISLEQLRGDELLSDPARNIGYLEIKRLCV